MRGAKSRSRSQLPGKAGDSAGKMRAGVPVINRDREGFAVRPMGWPDVHADGRFLCVGSAEVVRMWLSQWWVRRCEGAAQKTSCVPVLDPSETWRLTKTFDAKNGTKLFQSLVAE